MKLKTVAFKQEWYDAWMLAFNELKETSDFPEFVSLCEYSLFVMSTWKKLDDDIIGFEDVENQKRFVVHLAVAIMLLTACESFASSNNMLLKDALVEVCKFPIGYSFYAQAIAMRWNDIEITKTKEDFMNEILSSFVPPVETIQ